MNWKKSDNYQAIVGLRLDNSKHSFVDSTTSVFETDAIGFSGSDFVKSCRWNLVQAYLDDTTVSKTSDMLLSMSELVENSLPCR